ncbi:MAG: Smr/MutS family protein [Kiloniellales bacterium]|nr:Smr/MutS family protein [Kiloniellales bacterium]
MAGKKNGARGPGRGDGSEISEADRALWRKVTEDAKPLEKRAGRGAARSEPPSPEPRASEAPAPRKAAAPTRPASVGAERRSAAPDLEAGRASGLDRRNLERLRRGKLPIEATIDLHGDTQAAAHRRLGAFLSRSQAAGRRCILVITGKGRLGRGPDGAEPGVIRANLPRWLNEAPNRARVLAFAQAQPAHGGAGAFYVLLKRRRER